MAYTVGYEHTQATVNGEPHTYTGRATQIYWREESEWKVVRRHGDTPPTRRSVRSQLNLYRPALNASRHLVPTLNVSAHRHVRSTER